MTVPHDKILVRFTSESIEAIFHSTFVKDNGEVGRLSINVEAQDGDDRQHTLFTQAAVVEQVGKSVTNVKRGDIAILSYELFNDTNKFLKEDEEGKWFLLSPYTTYHKQENIAYSNQQNPKNQLVWDKGELDEVSQLLAVIRNGEFFANEPFVFLNEMPAPKKESDFDFEAEPEVIKKKIFSVSQTSAHKYDILNGDIIFVREPDTFPVKLFDKTLTACNDEDILMLQERSKMRVV